MAYTPTPWRDRAVERLRTYTLQNNPDGTVTLIPAPGIVYEAGTPVNAVNLKKVEDQLVLSDQHISRLAGVHGSTSAPTPSRIVQRSPTGTAEIATPVNASDIANKDYIDTRAGFKTRMNGVIPEYWSDALGAWVPLGGNLPVGYLRTSAGNGGANKTWTTITNITGVPGRLDSARVNGLGTIGIRVTIDGAVDTIYASHSDRDSLNNYWYLRDTESSIYFYNSFKMEIYSDDYIDDDGDVVWRDAYGEAKYRLKAGTP